MCYLWLINDIKDFMECNDHCIVLMQGIKNYGFIVHLEIWWLNLQKYISRSKSHLLYKTRIQVMRVVKSKKKKEKADN